MLKKEDNELLTRVGPGTPMGELLREYWAPAARSAALEADGAPFRVRMLGENFVAYRATDGRVGFIDEACPHRGASLALARNEDNSLRCIFHGWKIDIEGKLVETPCEPALRREAFAKTVKIRQFPTREAGGMVWVYLGKQKTPPQFPEFDYNQLPEDQVYVRRAVVHYNWLQGLEAHLDASHLGVLHSGQLTIAPINPTTPNNAIDLMLANANNAPDIEMDVTPYGIREGALRDQGDGNQYSRIRQIALPYFTFIPGSLARPYSARATIPIDDDWDAEWYIIYDPAKPLSKDYIETSYPGSSSDQDNFASNLGNVDNAWKQDRTAMKNGHFSGLVRNIPFEDFTVQELMGPRVDRSIEQLGVADHIIVHVRRTLLDAVRGFQEGKPAPWQNNIDYKAVRAQAVMHPITQNWRDLVPPTQVLASDKQAAE